VGGCAKDASNDVKIHGSLDEHSTSTQRALDEHSTTERKGREGSKEREVNTSLVADLLAGNVPDGGVDNCPHQAIIALYHEILPECPPVRTWHNGRARMLRQRWREDQKHQSLDWWRRLFGYVAESDFLAGRSQPQPGRSPFVADLEWLIRPSNMAKVIEGKYHHEATT